MSIADSDDLPPLPSSCSSSPSSPPSPPSLPRHTKILRTKDEKSSREILNGKYYLTNKSLGAGAYSVVELAECVSPSPTPSPSFVAIKKISKSRLSKIKEYGHGPMGRPKVTTALDKIYKEIIIHSSLNHQNIVGIKEIYDDENEDNLLIVLEYCEGGAIMEFDDNKKKYVVNHSLLSLPIVKEITKSNNNFILNPHGGLSEPFCKYLFLQLMRSVEYLHSSPQLIIHRDVKPDNCLGKIKTPNGEGKENPSSSPYDFITLQLCDFSVSKQFSPTESDLIMDTQGTYHFYSPEMCIGEEYSGYKSDIYMMGQTLYCWVTTRVPFWSEAGNPQELFDLIAEKAVEWPKEVEKFTTGEMKDFIMKLMCKNPKERMGFKEMREHPWITGKK